MNFLNFCTFFSLELEEHPVIILDLCSKKIFFFKSSPIETHGHQIFAFIVKLFYTATQYYFFHFLAI